MENQPFEVLEKKIDQLLTLYHRLKKDNQELRRKHMELTAVIEEKDHALDRLRQEAAQYQSAQAELATYQNKQDRVKEKVEKLIDKLKEFEEMA